MKIKNITAALAAIAISSTSLFAAADNTQKTDTPWLVDASKLEGTEVYDYHGHKLGDLQQVLIDPQTGRIRYGVMEVAKDWSWTDPQVAIPWDSFAVKRGDDKKVALSIDATKEKLEKAPKFKAGDADRLFSKEASQPIYSYWSIYWFEEPTATTQSKEDSTGSTKTVDQPGTSPTSNESADKNGATSGSTGTTPNVNTTSESDKTPAAKQ